MAQLDLAVFVLVADLQTAGLCVAHVGAGADLEELLLAGRPCLDVAGLDLQVGQVAGAALQLTDGDVQVAEQLDRVAPQLLIPVLGILGLADHDHLLLLELVDAIDAALLDAVRALLLAEAGRIGGQSLGQLLVGNDLVNEAADHGVLGGTDQIQVLALDLVHHAVHIGLGHNALNHVAMDHERGDAVSEALVDHEIAAISQNCLVQAGNVTQQIIETGAGNAAGSLQIDAVEGLHDVGVIGNGEGGNLALTEALHFHVGGVIGTDGHGGVDDLGDHDHALVQLFFQLHFQFLQLSQTVGLLLDLSLNGLGLGCFGRILLGLTHQHTDLLGQSVAVGAQLVGLHDGGAALAVQLNDFVHQRQLGVLELLLDVFSDSVGIFPDKLNVEHDDFSSI